MGKEKEARRWEREAKALSGRINRTMWDDSTGFYYHVDMKDHSFRFMTRDLRRQEIIGFLPLWAGVADSMQAAILVEKLTDTTKFWRRYGVPTLSAGDPFYSPYVDYCCKWNGPVWLLWDYMVYEGLRRYGYDAVAEELGKKMLKAVTTQLSVNHNYWESYSPDFFPLDCPSNYIWDSIMARLLIRLQELN
jgi:neutral trehalase